MSEGTFTLTMSPTIGKLAEALAKAQKAMPAVVKDSTNPHFKNRYASLAACIEATKILNDHGFAVSQPPIPCGPDVVGVLTLLLHSSGEWLRGELHMPASKRDAQGFGSALSYARRYCLQATANLATDDDDAEAAVRRNGDAAKPVAPGSAPKLVEAASTDKVVEGFIGRIESAKDTKALLTIYAENQASALPDAAKNYVQQCLSTKRKAIENGKPA